MTFFQVLCHYLPEGTKEINENPQDLITGFTVEI